MLLLLATATFSIVTGCKADKPVIDAGKNDAEKRLHAAKSYADTVLAIGKNLPGDALSLSNKQPVPAGVELQYSGVGKLEVEHKSLIRIANGKQYVYRYVATASWTEGTSTCYVFYYVDNDGKFIRGALVSEGVGLHGRVKFQDHY